MSHSHEVQSASESMTTSPGQVLGGQLSVPLYDLCIANRQVKPFCQRFLGPNSLPSFWTQPQKSQSSPQTRGEFLLNNWPLAISADPHGHWLSQLREATTVALPWPFGAHLALYVTSRHCLFAVLLLTLLWKGNWEEKNVRNMLSEGCLLKILLSAVIFKHLLKDFYTVGFP